MRRERIQIPTRTNIVFDLGEVEYEKILILQRHLNSLRNDGLVGDCIFFLEHPDIYTLGIHRNPEEILSGDITPVEVERGGSATYHGPGQLVIYEVVNLKEHSMNVKDLIEKTQNSINSMLENYGITGEGRLHGETGVWVGTHKICSIGYAIKGFSTLHGVGLNINTDLSKFESIMPCGMKSTVMTSMEKETGNKINEEDVRESLKKKILSSLEINEYLEIDDLKKGRDYLVGNGLGLFPEELLKVIV